MSDRGDWRGKGRLLPVSGIWPAGERLGLPGKTEKVKIKRGTGWNREAGRLFKTGRNQIRCAI